MRSRSSLALVLSLAVFGVLCLAAAAVLRWVVVPNRAELPSDENTTRQYDGTAKTLLNPQALNTGDLKTALLVNTPVTATRTVKALATTGSAAQVQDTRTLTTADGRPVGNTEATYAVDRTMLEATSDHPSSWQVTPATGLTVSWPIGAEKKDYTGWVQETQSTTTLRYLRQETKQDLTTYVYQAETQSAKIKDPQVLNALPKQLPVSTLRALSAALPLSPDLKARLATLLPRVTQPVPLSYAYQVKSTYWVEPTTGLVVDTQREDTRAAGITVSGQTITGILPVFDVATTYTSNSVADAANDAKDNKNTIDLFRTTLPLILLIVGVVALLGALLAFLLSRRPSSSAPPTSTGGGGTPNAATG
ncbi:MAG TPA: porin PorA family protein [Asanoa sp.]